jgi:pimeloyl-ACP methyl ester carboxylesterase
MLKINFFESGRGYPLVFIHGFCESNKIWTDLSTHLSDEYRIICPDLPGFGKSTLPGQGFTLEQIADQLVDWLKSLEISECIAIGHSLGGYIALEMLRKHQEFVKAIGLFNSSAFEDSEDKKENRNKLIQFIDNNGVAPFLKTFVPSLFYPPTSKHYQHIIDEIEKDGLSIKPESVMRYAAAMRDRRDGTDLLKNILRKSC